MDTKSRIQQAALELFGEYGLGGASVRDICARAQANIAAVNYYFGGKDALYAAVVKAVFEDTYKIARMPQLDDAPNEPEQQMAKWIDWYIRRQYDPRAALLMTFIRREIADPTPMLQEIIDNSITPMYIEMRRLVVALLPADTSEELINLHCGQINGPPIVRVLLAPIRERMPAHTTSIDIDLIVAHTQRSVMAGLKAAGAQISGQWTVAC